MNKLLTQIIDGLLAVVPLERIVASGLNALIARIGQAPTAKTAKTLAHIREAVDIAERVIRDGQVTAAEVTEVREQAQLLRLSLLGIWAEGGADKPLEAALAKAEVSAKKIKGPKRNGKGGREFPVMFDIAGKAQTHKTKKGIRDK